MLSFQHQGKGVPCDQIYTMPVDTPDGKPATPKLVSTGKGRTTCSYIFPSGDRILYSSTHAASPECPPKPDYSKGYVWPIYDTYKIYTAKLDGSDLKLLTDAPGYNAESTISRDGKKIVFTSTRNGDLDIYTMNADGTHVKQLTHELGYDGGPFWSYDGKKIVYRAEHPKTPAEIADYKALYAQGLIRPGNLEIWVMDADGKNKQQVTHNGAANFAPFFHPDGKRIIFASNHGESEERSRLRPLHHQRGRNRAAAHYVLSRLRRVPHVHLRRQAAGVGFEPQRQGPARDEYFHCGLGGG